MKGLLRNRSLWLVVMVLAIGATTLAFVVSSRAPSALATADSSVPQWLVTDASTIVTNFRGSDKTATSATWIKTTWGDYVNAAGSTGDRTSAKPAYVVVVHGRFASPTAKGSVLSPVEGELLVMAYDATTQELSNVDLFYEAGSFKEAALGKASSIQLTAD